MLHVLKIIALVTLVVFLNAVTTLLFIHKPTPVSAGPQCVSGDVNGDLTVDITDPVHLLSYIFEGGPEPVACAQVPAGITALELDGVLRNYMLSPRDYAYFKVESPGLGPDELLLFETGQESFLVTRFVVDIPCWSGDPSWTILKVNGDADWGARVKEQLGFGVGGYMLPPGAQVTVQNLDNSDFCSANPGAAAYYRYRLEGFWQN